MFNRDPNTTQFAIRLKADIVEALKSDPNNAQVLQTLERFILEGYAVTATGSLLDEGLVLYFHSESAARQFRTKLDENRVTQSVWPSGFGPAKTIAPGETYVFISHASEDQVLAEQLARGLGASGIDTFIDSDDITGNTSFAARINQALVACTHFVALLTPVAASKHWVQHELLSITSRVVKREVAFFALATHGYNATMFQRQFATLAHVPLRQFTETTDVVPQLISDILGLARKPLNGPLPLVATKPKDSGLSRAAFTLAEWLIRQSETGRNFDPRLDLTQPLPSELSFTNEDLRDAIDELQSLECIFEHEASGMWAISARAQLFARFDQTFNIGNPDADAQIIAARLMANGSEGEVIGAQELAEQLGWAPRRMNPAIQWLLSRTLLKERNFNVGDLPYLQFRLIPNADTRRFVKLHAEPTAQTRNPNE